MKRRASSVSLAVGGVAAMLACTRLSAQPTSNDLALAAAFPDLGGMDARTMMLEDPIETFVLFDQFERREGNDAMSWDLEAWSGRNLDKLFVRSEGERESGRTGQAEVELFWAHAVAPWWDLVAGIRYDTAPGPSRSWAAFGVQGFAPYSFDIEATAYLGEGSHAAARVEADFELLITQRLVLQPLAELRWYSRDDPEHALGSGLSSIEIGLRLRYEFRREIAPYIGITRSRLYGGTADYARAKGADADETQWVAGLRFWF